MTRSPRNTTAAGPRRRDAGNVTGFFIVAIGSLLLFAGLVIDGGRALDARVQALDLAQSAARAGAAELDLTALRTTGHIRLDPVRARQSALDYLRAAGADGKASATTTTVTVTVQRRQDTLLLRLAGISALTVSETQSAVTRTEPNPGG